MTDNEISEPHKILIWGGQDIKHHFYIVCPVCGAEINISKHDISFKDMLLTVHPSIAHTDKNGNNSCHYFIKDDKVKIV